MMIVENPIVKVTCESPPRKKNPSIDDEEAETELEEGRVEPDVELIEVCSAKVGEWLLNRCPSPNSDDGSSSGSEAGSREDAFDQSKRKTEEEIQFQKEAIESAMRPRDRIFTIKPITSTGRALLRTLTGGDAMFMNDPEFTKEFRRKLDELQRRSIIERMQDRMIVERVRFETATFLQTLANLDAAAAARKRELRRSRQGKKGQHQVGSSTLSHEDRHVPLSAVDSRVHGHDHNGANNALLLSRLRRVDLEPKDVWGLVGLDPLRGVTMTRVKKF